MKSTSWVMCTAAVLAGCSMNSSTPLTAWGKKDVSMLDYRTDAGQCALIAVTMSTDGNGANTAGGISGQNPTPPPQGPSRLRPCRRGNPARQRAAHRPSSGSQSSRHLSGQCLGGFRESRRQRSSAPRKWRRSAPAPTR